MKKLFCFLVLTVQLAAAQVIKGNVYDTQTEEPLVGVSVYFDGTTVATITDDKGAFSINMPQGLNKSLIFSFIGYEKVVLEDAAGYKAKLKVLMKENAEVIAEVVIQGKTLFSRKEMLRVFRKQFLGSSRAGKSCRIENEDDIELYYDSGTATLHALAKKPLRITNKYLQYDINFDLAAFEISYFKVSLDENFVNSTFYAGTTFFKDTSEKGSAYERRGQAYLGSATHLMRTIYSNDWQKQGFEVYVDSWPSTPESCFAVTDSLGYKKVMLKELPAPEVPNLNGMKQTTGAKRDFTKTKYDVLYKRDKQTGLVFNERSFYINEYGLFYPIQALVFTGYMGSLKAGDLLPDDYQYIPAD
jgi:hypothetical protein